MKYKYFLGILYLTVLIILSSFFVYASGTLQCYFSATSSCDAGNTKLIGLQNESGGWDNAHAQNRTLGTYANSICCNTTNSSITIATGCNGANVVRLFSEDNTHVQTGNNTDYSISACLNSSYKNITCSYTTSSCAAGNTCVMTFGNSEGENNTNAHVGNCSGYSLKACCGLSNNAPTAPTLVYPVNGNTTVFERQINFTWAHSTDAEGNSITYSFNATCGSSCTCSTINLGSISVNYSYASSELCFDKIYNWSVTACDIYNECTTSSKSNFTIASIVDFVLINNATDFGLLALGENKITSTSGTAPFVGRNNGNVKINATINASAVFSSVSMNTNYYQFFSEDNESSSIVTSCSQTTQTPMNTSKKVVFCNLSHSDTSDEVRIHINLTVPLDEISGTKSSNVDVSVLSAE